MTTTNGTLPSPPGQEALPPEVFEALIAYEDLASGLAARRCLERLALDLGTDARLTLWRLDLLKEPDLAARAVRDAAAADVVVLSLPGEHPLSSAVKDWLGAWLDQRGERDGALGVLLEWERRQTQSASETLAFLQWVTQRHPVDLFAGYFRAISDGPTLAVEDIRKRAETTTRVLAGILHRPEMPQSRWGINE